MAKGMVSGLTGVVNVVNNVLSALDKVGATTPAVLGTLASMFMTLKGLGTDTAIPNLFKSLAPKTWGSISDTFGNVNVSAMKMNGTLSSTGKQVTKLTNGASKYSGTMRVVSKGFTSTKLGAVAANVGITALNAGIIALGGVVASFAVKGVDYLLNRSEKLAEASRTRQAEIKGEIDSNKQQISSLSAISKEYDELTNKTNKSKEEVKRFNELKQEIATISPELVMGYDENNSPILAINGSLEQTIALKKELLALDQQILAEEKKQEVEANRDKSERLWEKQGYTKDKYDGGSDKAGNAQKDAFETTLYNGNVKAYKKSLEEKKSAYNEYIGEMSKARSEYNEIELKAQQSAITELNSSLSGKKLNDKTLQNINSVAGAFNWGQLSASETQQVQQGFDNLNNSFGKFDTQGFQTKVNNLSRDFEAGSISKEQYEKGIGSLADTLIKAGVDVDRSTLMESLKQFPPELREIDYAMAGVLSTFGLKLSDLGSNVKADMLFDQMGKMSSLTDKFANSIETTGTIGVNLIPEIGSDIYNTLPTQIQGAIDTIMSDGNVTEQEAEILMKLMTSWEQDGEISEDEINELISLEELDGKVVTTEMRAKLQADVDDDYRKYVINSTKEGQNLSSSITSKFKAEGADEYTKAYEKAGVEPGSKEGKKIKNEIDAKFEQQGFETSQNVVDTMESLGLTTGKEQSNFMSTIEAQIETGNMNLSDLESAETILDWLYAHPEITSKYGIEVVGKETISEVEKSLNELELGKEEKKSILVDIQEGDLAGLESTLNKMPEEKRTAVLMEIGDALSKINTVDAITLRDKLAKIFGVDLATPTVDAADQHKRNMNKEIRIDAADQSRGKVAQADTFKREMFKLVTINALDLATSVINGLNLSPVKKVVSVVAQKVGDAWNWLTGRRGGSSGGGGFSGGGGGHMPRSLSSEDTPAPMSTPQTETPPGFVDNKTPSKPQISPRSATNFGGISTSKTLSTGLPKSIKNILSLIKYGINLFQELENRIDRVKNQVDLLNLKMEDAVGTKRIGYLKTQNKLYAEQAKLQKTLFNSLNNERTALKSKVKSLGFKRDSQGNLSNYEETLKKYESAYESAKKKEDAYSGKSEKTKKKLSKATESANKKLEDAKKYSDEYLDVCLNKIPSAEQEWQKLQNAIKENNNEIEKLEFEDKIYKEQHAIEKLNSAYEQYSNYLDRAKKRGENANGAKKIKYLQQELEHTKKLIEIQKELQKQYASERKDYKSKLGKYGAKFNKENGQIDNEDAILNKYKNTSDYEKVKDWINDYKNLLDSERDCKNEIIDFTNETKNLADEMEKLKRIDALYKHESQIKKLENEYDILSDKIDLIDVKLNNASGIDKMKLMEEKIALINKQMEIQKKLMDSLNAELKVYQKDLGKYGAKFDGEGNISNLDELLNKYKDSDDLEKINELIEEYISKVRDELPDAEKEYENLGNTIKDVYEEQLNITKEVEDKLTEIYKKQLEDKKDAIKKQADEEIKMLDKKRKAYQQFRDEQNYKDDFNDQNDAINKLKKQLEIAKRDDSLSGKKKVQDILEQIEEENKKLQDIVQDKIDSDINNTFDEETDKIQEDSDKKIEDLEKLWTDSKIAEMIKEALGSGVFTDLDGNVSNLQDTLLNFAKESGEALGVLGDKIQKELCDKLKFAQEVMDKLPDIMNKLEIESFSGNLDALRSVNSRTVSIGDTNINIQGDVNEGVVKMIRQAVKEGNEKLIKELNDRV